MSPSYEIFISYGHLDDMFQRLILPLTGLILAQPTFAQKQSTETFKQPVQTAIRAARLLDVKTGALISNAVVLVEGERIVGSWVGTNHSSGRKRDRFRRHDAAARLDR